MRKLKKITIGLIIFILFVGIAGLSFIAIWGLNSYETESDKLQLALQSDNVQIQEFSNYYKISPKNKYSNKTLIFYPGARITSDAYLYKLSKISTETDLEIYITKPLFNFAIFSINDAETIIKNETNDNKIWFIGGHSLGGAMACQFLSGKSETYIKGLILFGSYCGNDISDQNQLILTIFADKDNFTTMEKLEQNKKYLPEDALTSTINGMNHSQFGNYGLQENDNNPDISDDLVIEKLVNEINYFINLE